MLYNKITRYTCSYHKSNNPEVIQTSTDVPLRSDSNLVLCIILTSDHPLPL